MKKKLPIFYSVLLLTGVNLLLRFAGTGFGVYLSRLLGAEGMGLLQLALSVGSLMTVAGMAGARTATMYLTAGELGSGRKKNVPWVLSACFCYSFLISISLGLGCRMLAPELASRWVGNEAAQPALRVLAGFLPVTCLCGVMTGYFTAANRIGTLAGVEICEQLTSMSATVLLLSQWAKHDPGRACCAVVMGNGIGNLLTLSVLFFLRHRTAEKPAQRIAVTRQLLGIAVPLALADDCKTGLGTLENLTVPRRLSLHTEGALAAFGTVTGMVFPILMFPSAIVYALAELLIPEMARCHAADSRDRIGYLLQRSLRVTLVYGVVFGGLLYLGGSRLGLTLYKSEAAGEYLTWFAFLAPMLYCDAIVDAMVKGLGRQRVSVGFNIFTSLLDVVFLYFLLPVFGVKGYFFSFFITHAINFYLSAKYLFRIAKVRTPIRTPLFAAEAMLFGAWVCSSLTSLTARACCYLLILGSLLFLLRVLKKEDLQWIKSLVMGR